MSDALPPDDPDVVEARRQADAYLAPLAALLPPPGPWHEHAAAHAAERLDARDAARIAALNAAADDWRTIRQRSETNAAATAVLKLHRPHSCGAHGDRIGCTGCREYEWGGDRAVGWPCHTYTAIKENTP